MPTPTPSGQQNSADSCSTMRKTPQVKTAKSELHAIQCTSHSDGFSTPQRLNPQSLASELPRVLYVVAMDPSQKFGSIEEQIVVLANAFRQHGSLMLPLFICPCKPLFPTAIEKAGIPIETLDMGRFHWRVLAQLLTIISRNKIECVHWNFTHPIKNCYLWGVTLLCPRIRHLYSEHTSHPFPLPEPVQGTKLLCKKVLLKRYTKVLCVSQFLAEGIKSEKCWSHVVYCPHFVNVERFRPCQCTRTEIRAKHNAADCFVILAVAHLIYEKGVHVILHAIRELHAKVVLWIVGAGTAERDLRQLAQDLELGERVVFHGSQSFIEPYMQGADCFVCPSLWAEAAGLVNLEAQASGLPVLASNVGGIPEYVSDGATGYLFPRGDSASLAILIQRLVTNSDLRENLGKAGRELIEKKFSVAARLPDVLSSYRSYRDSAQ